MEMGANHGERVCLQPLLLETERGLGKRAVIHPIASVPAAAPAAAPTGAGAARRSSSFSIACRDAPEHQNLMPQRYRREIKCFFITENDHFWSVFISSAE